MSQRDKSIFRSAPFEHIFVATDFSASADQAIARASRLPLAARGIVTILHVLPERMPKSALPAAEKAARGHLAQARRSVVQAAAKQGRRGVKVVTEISRGQPYVDIVRCARSAGADLIVLGRHGRRALRDMFIGSTAESVIRVADLPVLVVSGKASRTYQRPLLGVDLGDTSRFVVTVALRALGTEVASFTMVHAYHVPFEGFVTPGVSPAAMTDLRKEYRAAAASRVAKLQQSLTEQGVACEVAVVRGDPRSVIVSEAVRRRADLVVVGTHGRSGIAHALLGSVAAWVIQAAASDVLVARPGNVTFVVP